VGSLGSRVSELFNHLLEASLSLSRVLLLDGSIGVDV
jgi:hypothetical protein